jgi:hypothetical protein
MVDPPTTPTMPKKSWKPEKLPPAYIKYQPLAISKIYLPRPVSCITRSYKIIRDWELNVLSSDILYAKDNTETDTLKKGFRHPFYVSTVFETQTSHNIDCALGPLCYIRACSLWIAWQRSSPMKGELRLRGANSVYKFGHHNINGSAVDDTWCHR